MIDTKRILIFACLIGAAVSCREQQPVEPVVLDDTFAIEQPTPGTVLTRLALAMTVNGAEGKTAEEMLGVLGYGSSSVSCSDTRKGSRCSARASSST